MTARKERALHLNEDEKYFLIWLIIDLRWHAKLIEPFHWAGYFLKLHSSMPMRIKLKKIYGNG